MADAVVRNYASGHYSPLRYPGGKGKLARFVAALIRRNSLADGFYVEPYAGGAAVALELLLTGVVRRVAINDLSKPIYEFWKSVLFRTDELLSLIKETPVSLENRMRLKRVFNNPNEYSDLELGFATFFLNRTNRSGILNGGVIGGNSQTGAWKIDARYNKSELSVRIERIARCRNRVELTNIDAVDFINARCKEWYSRRILVYLDPPYHVKGRDLYYDFYNNADHLRVRDTLHGLQGVNWIVSYDDVEDIRNIYEGYDFLKYTIGYSAREITRGHEAMFFSPKLIIPSVQGSMIEINRSKSG